jgi:hypothetical protein
LKNLHLIPLLLIGLAMNFVTNSTKITDPIAEILNHPKSAYVSLGMSDDNPTFYQVLRIANNATKTAIEKAYDELQEESTVEEYNLLTAAKEILLDKNLRNRYDTYLKDLNNFPLLNERAPAYNDFMNITYELVRLTTDQIKEPLSIKKEQLQPDWNELGKKLVALFSRTKIEGPLRQWFCIYKRYIDMVTSGIFFSRADIHDDANYIIVAHTDDFETSTNADDLYNELKNCFSLVLNTEVADSISESLYKKALLFLQAGLMEDANKTINMVETIVKIRFIYDLSSMKQKDWVKKFNAEKEKYKPLMPDAEKLGADINKNLKTLELNQWTSLYQETYDLYETNLQIGAYKKFIEFVYNRLSILNLDFFSDPKKNSFDQNMSDRLKLLIDATPATMTDVAMLFNNYWFFTLINEDLRTALFNKAREILTTQQSVSDTTKMIEHLRNINELLERGKKLEDTNTLPSLLTAIQEVKTLIDRANNLPEKEEAKRDINPSDLTAHLTRLAESLKTLKNALVT